MSVIANACSPICLTVSGIDILSRSVAAKAQELILSTPGSITAVFTDELAKAIYGISRILPIYSYGPRNIFLQVFLYLPG